MHGWPPLFAIGILPVASLVFSVGRERSAATSVFAQAYGLGCTACHAQMPTLNAFGRYIQRNANFRTQESLAYDVGSQFRPHPILNRLPV